MRERVLRSPTLRRGPDDVLVGSSSAVSHDNGWRASPPRSKATSRLAYAVLTRSGPLALSGSGAQRDHVVVSEQPHACPYCELRFTYHDEVRDHILRDHPDHRDVAVTAEIHELPHSSPG